MLNNLYFLFYLGVKSSLKMKFKDEKELKSIPEGVEEM
jgi:hypothetical protein